MLETFFAQKRDVTAAISELVTIATRVGAKALAARVDADLVQKLQEDRFHLVVVGEFNHGKSTFVNALLGRSVLPVGVTPTTAVIHHLEYGDTPAARVVKENGEKQDLPFDEVRRFAVSASAAEGSDTGIDPHDVKYLEVFYPAPLLKERIVLVDTPGVNDLSLQRADITYSYIPKSDAVLFLLDAGQPLKESERVFLQEKLLGEGRNKIIFVVTKRDIWDAAEEREALEYIRAELGKILDNATVFPVSAERALGEKPESGFPQLVDHLTSFLAKERGRILLDNALGKALDVGTLLAKGVDARRRAIQMSSEELDRRIAVLEQDLAGQQKTLEQRRSFIREEIAGIKAWIRRDVTHFAEDTIKQLPQMIDNAKVDEIKVHLGPFLERAIVEWAERETKEIGAALEKLAERTVALVREDANETAKRLSENLGTNVKAPTVEVDTLRYDLGVVALLTVGAGVFVTNALLGGILAAAALPFAMFVRNRVEKQTREKARELAPQAIREASEKLLPKLEEMVAEFAARLDAWVITAGEELHRELLEILKAARDERRSGAEDTTASLAACEREVSVLEKALGGIEKLRGALWNKPAEESATTASGAPAATSPAASAPAASPPAAASASEPLDDEPETPATD